MTQKSVTWDQTAKVESWNLILNVTKQMNFPLSPIATGTYNFLYNYFFNGGSLTEYDLITLCITSMFVTIKSEGRDEQITNVIQKFAPIAAEFSGDRKNVFGNSVDSLKLYVKKNNERHFQVVHSNVLQCEFSMLTANKWEFITDHPFSFLNYWLEQVKLSLKKNPNYQALKTKFDEMRTKCVHNLCLLLITQEGPWPTGAHFAANALLYTIFNFEPILNPEYADFLNKQLSPKLENKQPFDFAALEKRVNDAIIP
ncbi:hypothetical protein TVAG_198650 [Trichomonas vaginalis G3]|uniref:Uncharacterized protein n=1 Tax=Trichomonas vaginalis (strain ATCC PRA-98 / G3) TaxID=412133 RepID=A2DDQ0_TRIV3|nr:hypothetical protein TVAGG3_0999070 [Trichomonas vaginalis G3]EAY21426.1 hypothetical protein TVAG_198650 [Trichomonas vaginalis G3]KAI5490638.1 hypothetical protein TVAGG3_0999070 [Trichomonas vaginalis G3]|eukprot:XP_001582412.1 hypothetical protein [Trichomonas vaginalis G3]